MCGGVNIIYGQKDIEYENSGQAPDPEVIFQLEDLVNKELPLEGDLILNIDGCFYRVENITEDEFIETTRVTLQGSGVGGGGSAGGGGGTSSTSYSINVDPLANVFSSTADVMEINFYAISETQTENYINYVGFTIGSPISEENKPFYEINNANYQIGTLQNKIVYSIDLVEFKNLFSSTGVTTLYLNTIDVYGVTRSKRFNIQIVELSLGATQNLIISTKEEKYTYSCNVSGAVSGITNKKLIFTFAAENSPANVIFTYEDSLNNNFIGTKTSALPLGTLEHGVYVMKVIAQAQIAGSSLIITSNELTHQMIVVKDETNPLLAVMIPTTLEQYTNIPLTYLLASKEENKNYTMNILIDGENKSSLNIVTNKLDSYNLFFEEKGTYALNVSIAEIGGLEKTFQLDVLEYTGNLPVIDSNDQTLMLYMNPKGQSNNSINRDEWPEYHGRYTGRLENALFSSASGWLEDSDGASYLKLTSGAKFSIPDFKPFAIDPTKPNILDSRFGYGMTIELDFEVNGVVDYSEDEPLISCLSQSQTDKVVGFIITGNKVKLYNNRLNDSINDKGEPVGTLSTLTIVEGKRIRLSFVIEPSSTTSISSITGETVSCPMCYTYLNGKMSSAVLYQTDDEFKDHKDDAAIFEADSKNGQIKIYGIRFYSTALSDRTILNNYTASLSTFEEREARFESNNVYNINNKIDYKLVSAEGYNLQIPYMTITGGYETEEESKWQLKSAIDMGSNKLPTGKKNYRMIDVDVIYPKNNLFKNYQDFSFKSTFENGLGMKDNYGNKAKRGCIMYAQGTSSMEYPVKNLRLRFKEEEDFFTVKPEIAPVEIICMKADYMESSGSHNTGAANLVDALYRQSGFQTPGQEHFGGEGKLDIVTCIKGHPCLIFYRPDENSEYEYVGKYNLNLDKATPEPFGFNHDDSTFGYLEAGEEYYKIQYDEEGEYVEGQVEEKATVQEGEKINSIHCFEFLDNSVEVCNFLEKAKEIDPVTEEVISRYSFYDTWYGTFDGAPGWTLGFESRYPEDKVGYHDADALYPLASWLNELYKLRQKEEADGLSPSDIINTYEYSAPDTYDDSVEYWILSEDGESYERVYLSEEDFGTNEDRQYLIRTLVNSRFEMTSLERFKREFKCYLDETFLLFYYIFTEALLMADNRVKNMMIATWGKEKRSYIDLDGNVKETNNYIFYPIFYDMDTMLGLDNTGVNRFAYYDNDESADTYNGDEVLWLFVRDALFDKLPNMYNTLEGKLLNIDIDEVTGKYKGIIPYFNDNQADMANEAFYNGDADYKYLNPARVGYYDGLNEESIAAGKGPYLYAAQGDRSLNRESFIVNRIKFLRGKYNSNKFKSGDRINFRWGYPKGNITDEQLANSVKVVKPSGKFDLVSLQTCYAGVRLGANGPVERLRFDGEESKELIYSGAMQANGTEAYILGVSNLQDVGDLSTKYMQKFIMPGTGNKLRRLTLGNPHKDYYNPYWKPKTGNAYEIGLTGCTYLQYFNLQNCSTYNNALNFLDCPVIETILLTGSSVNSLKLPVNGLLKELRLPTTIKTLTINSHKHLSEDNFSIGKYNYGEGEKIGEKDAEGNLYGSYENNYSGLQNVCIIDTPINTYDMVKGAYELSGYYLHGFSWKLKNNDSFYCKPKESERVDSKIYYILNTELGVYEAKYGNEISNEDWKYAREKVELVTNGEITTIPVLDYLLELEGKNENGVVVQSKEALKGTIEIAIEAKVNEYNIYKKYIDVFPNVKFVYNEAAIGKDNLTKAHTIEFFNVDIENITETTEPYYSVLTNKLLTLEELTKDLPTPSRPSTVDTVYIFTNTWKNVKTGEIYSQEDFSNITPQQDMQLSAIFDAPQRAYTVKYYDHTGQNIIKEVKYIYGQSMISNSETLLYLERDESGLEWYERYGFKGWSLLKDFKNPNAPIIDLNMNVIYDFDVFAKYEKEDCRKTATDLKYFDFTIVNINIPGTSNKIECNMINLKPEYQNQFSGKLTLPNRDNKGTLITALGKITGQITHIFFLDEAPYQFIGTGELNTGIYNQQKLKQIYFGNNITALKYISQWGLSQNSNLKDIINLPNSIQKIGPEGMQGNSELKLSSLPESLDFISQSCFTNCYDISVSTLPLGIKEIPTRAFQNCWNLKINVFGNVGAETDVGYNNLISIGDNAFANAGTTVSTIKIGNSIEHLSKTGLFTYGAREIPKTIDDYSTLLTADNWSEYFDNANKNITFNNVI